MFCVETSIAPQWPKGLGLGRSESHIDIPGLGKLPVNEALEYFDQSVLEMDVQWGGSAKVLWHAA